MSEPPPQSFASHTQIVPGFHYGVIGIFAFNLLYSFFRLYRVPGLHSAMGVLLAIGFLGLVWYVRIFPLRAQDRVIRLEMRLRLREVLPADLQPHVAGLRPRHLIALRFASDAELPELVREIVAGRLTAPREIKQKIRDWQADHLRV